MLSCFRGRSLIFRSGVVSGLPSFTYSALLESRRRSDEPGHLAKRRLYGRGAQVAVECACFCDLKRRLHAAHYLHAESLPAHRLAAAAQRAIEINPANALQHRQVARTPIGRRGGPRRLAVLIGRRWPASGVRLTVKFIDNPPKDLRARILLHMNAWGKTANVLFTETQGAGKVRLARFDSPPAMAGYWSWIGTEILEIAQDQPTINLEAFTMKISESEFHRVVRHEAGHTLGFEHEHMRGDLVKQIDPTKAYAFFDKTQGWNKQEVDAQVITPLADKSIMGTAESDPQSIMCYQIPGSITKTGKPIVGGTDINPKDFAFAASIYPKQISAPRTRR